MKKILYSIFAIFVLVSITSCNKLLEVKPDNLTGIDEGIQNASDLQAVLNGAYDVFRNNNVMGGYAYVAADVLVQEAYATGTGFEWGQIKSLNMNLFNPIGRDIWSNSYLCIARANVVIDYIDNDKVTLTAAEKKQWKAEAQFIRALSNFHLVQFFALPYDATKVNSQPGIPLRKEAVLINEFAATLVPRSSVEEVYQSVISDLLDAESNLSSTPILGHAPKDAATAYLAKVYFQMNNMTKAYQYADVICTSGNYSLDSLWWAKFAVAALDSTTHEVIFAMTSTASTNNSAAGYTDSYRTNNVSVPAFGPTTSLVGILKDVNTDLRATQVVLTAGPTNVPGVYSNKFNYEFMNAPIICYNEILLIRAEAGLAIGSGDPVADLNAIQTRASVPLTAATIDNITAERRKEFALEGKHLFNLKRLKSTNIHGESWNSSRLIFQIPDIEQNGNPDIILN